MKYRGSIWTLGFWLKLTLTCGFYIFWWWNDYIIVTQLYVAHVWGIPNKKIIIPMNKVREVRQDVHLLSTLFGYADVYINSLDHGAIIFRGLQKGKDLVESLC